MSSGREVETLDRHPSGKPYDVDRNPDGVHDRELDHCFDGKTFGPERKTAEECGVDRVGFWVDRLQQNASDETRSSWRLDECDLSAGKRDAESEIEQIANRSEEESCA